MQRHRRHTREHSASVTPTAASRVGLRSMWGEDEDVEEGGGAPSTPTGPARKDGLAALLQVTGEDFVASSLTESKVPGGDAGSLPSTHTPSGGMAAPSGMGFTSAQTSSRGAAPSLSLPSSPPSGRGGDSSSAQGAAASPSKSSKRKGARRGHRRGGHAGDAKAPPARVRGTKEPWQSRDPPFPCVQQGGCCASAWQAPRVRQCCVALDDAVDLYADIGAQIRYYVTDTQWFNYLIAFCILATAASVGTITYGQRLTPELPGVLTAIDTTILSVFVAEAALKIWAEGRSPQAYFQDAWNAFDFAVRAAAAASRPHARPHTPLLCPAQVVLASFLPIPQQDVSLIRLIRLLRVLKVVRALPGLRVLVVSLLKSLHSLSYIAGLLLLLVYMYGVLGYSMFHRNDPANFATLHVSMLTLFRVTTGDDWEEVFMTNFRGCDQVGYGTEQFTGEIGGRNKDGFDSVCTQPEAKPWQSVLFFVSYIFLTTFILINVIVGVVVSSVAEAQEEARAGTRVTVQVIRCTNLVSVDWLTGADPFVTLSMGDTKHKTPVRYGTVDPWWAKEVAHFAPLEEFKVRTLHVHVKDYNRFSRNESLGWARIDLDALPYNRDMELSLRLRGAASGVIVLKVRKALSASDMDPSKLALEDRLVHSVALAREHWEEVVEEVRLSMHKRKLARRKALRTGRGARSNLLTLSRAFMALHESYSIMLLRFKRAQMALAKRAELAASAQRRAALAAVQRGEGLHSAGEGGSASGDDSEEAGSVGEGDDIVRLA